MQFPPTLRAAKRAAGDTSRATVTQSYEQLISEGYLQAAIGSGTKVCAQLPDDLLRTTPVKAMPGNSIKAATQKIQTPTVKLSHYGAGLDNLLPLEAPEPELPINFKSGRELFCNRLISPSEMSAGRLRS